MKRRAEFRHAMAGMALCIGASVFASPIARIDIFEKADNHLPFVTFDYNATGECAGSHGISSDGSLLGNGTYVVRVTVNGVAPLTRLITVER